MKVRELIQLLSEHDPELPVCHLYINSMDEYEHVEFCDADVFIGEYRSCENELLTDSYVLLS